MLISKCRVISELSPTPLLKREGLILHFPLGEGWGEGTVFVTNHS